MWTDVSKRAVKAGVLVACISLFAGCDTFVSDESRMEKAQSLAAEQQFRAASLELKRLLQKNAEHKDARLLLGNVLLNLGDFAAAEEHLRKALKAGVAMDAVAPGLAQAHLGQGKFDEAVRVASKVQSQDANTQKKLLVIMGDASLGARNFATADKYYQRAMALDGSFVPALLGMARSAFAQKAFDRAGSILGTILQSEPEQGDALLLRGQLHALNKEYTDAEQVFSNIVKSSNEAIKPATKFTASVSLVEMLYQQQKLDEARVAVDALNKNFANQPHGLYLSALIEYTKGDYEQALITLQKLSSMTSEYKPSLFLSGATNYALNNMEQASRFLRAALQHEPNNVQAAKLLAATHMRLNQPEEASSLIKAVLDENQGAEDSSLLVMLGKANLQAGQTQAGIEYIKKSAAANPDNDAIMFDLATAYMAAGDYDKGMEVLNSLPATGDDGFRRDLLLVMANMRKKDTAAAIKEAEAAIKRHPDNISALLLAGNVHLAATNFNMAQKYFNQAVKREPDNVSPHLNLGRLYVAQGNFPAATAKFKHILTLQAGHQYALITLAKLAVNEDKPEEAVDWYKQAIAANPDSLQPRLQLLKYELVRKNYASAEKVASEGLLALPHQLNLISGLAAALLGQGKNTAAEAALRRELAANPDASLLYYNLARVKMVDQKMSAAKSLLQQALSKEPGNVLALYDLAIIEESEENIEAAVKHLQSIQALTPNAAKPFMLEGDVWVRQKQYQKAIGLYKVAQGKENTGQLLLKLFAAKRRAGEKVDEQPLLAWLARKPQDHKVRLFLAEHYQNTKRNTSAIKEYEQLLKVASDNIIVLNNLAWLYDLENNPKAADVAKKAYEINPEVGAIVDTYGWILVRKGALDEGVELLRQAHKLSPKIPDIEFHLAFGLSKAGSKKEAQEILARILANDAVFPERKAAESLYQELKSANT